MKKHNLINIFIFLTILGLTGECGKKEETSQKNPFTDPQQMADVICNKMFDCIMQEAKMINLPNGEVQIKTLKENCKSTMIQYIEKQAKKEVKEIPKDGATQEEIVACFNAIKNATCEEIKNNQIQACNELNKYTTQ